MAAVTAAVVGSVAIGAAKYDGAKRDARAAGRAAASWQDFSQKSADERMMTDVHGTKTYDYSGQGGLDEGTGIQLAHQELMDRVFGGKGAELSTAGQFQMDQGLKALGRKGAAGGAGGTMNYDMVNYAQGLASQDYYKNIDMLMQMSGGTAAESQAAGQNMLANQSNALSKGNQALAARASAKSASGMAVATTFSSMLTGSGGSVFGSQAGKSLFS